MLQQVRCSSTAISVNLWVPHRSDPHARVDEALVKVVLAALMTGDRADVEASEEGRESSDWLNPNEEQPTCMVAMEMLDLAVQEHIRGRENNQLVQGGISCSQEPSCSRDDQGYAEGLSIMSKRARQDSSPRYSLSAKHVTLKDVFLSLSHPEVIAAASRVLLQELGKEEPVAGGSSEAGNAP